MVGFGRGCGDAEGERGGDATDRRREVALCPLGREVLFIAPDVCRKQFWEGGSGRAAEHAVLAAGTRCDAADLVLCR